MKPVKDVVKDRVTQIGENQNGDHRLTKAILGSLSAVYGALVSYRLRRYERGLIKVRRLPCPVISVGNLTVGGTGKTPTTVFIARQLRSMGYGIVVISRGYKGRLEKKGGIISDSNGVLLGPDQAGDEPYLMAQLLPSIPVIVGADRYIAGCLAMDHFNPQVILLDDGFQHIRLHRDLNLLLMDGQSPLGNGFLLPRGPLREPPEACTRAHALVYTRWAGKEKRSNALPKPCRWLPTFYCSHRPVIRFQIPKGRPCRKARLLFEPVQKNKAVLNSTLFVFSGLARNADFHKSVRGLGGQIVDSQSFNDHHRYTIADLEAINERAINMSCRYLLTTDKDYVRIPQEWRFGLDLIVLGVEIDFDQDEENHWNQFLIRSLQEIAIV